MSLRELPGGQAVEPELELERRGDRDQVGVAAALAVAVHRALDQTRPGLDGEQRVGGPAAGVVMGVDTDRRSRPELRRRPLAPPLIPGSAGMTRWCRRASRSRRPPRAPPSGNCTRVVRIGAEAVEEVLGVIDHPLALATRKATDSAIIARFSSGSTLVTFSRCSRQVLPTSVQTGAKESRGAAGRDPRPRRGPGVRVMPKAATSRVCERLRREQLEERLFLRVRAGEAGLDVVHTEVVEGVGDTQLLLCGERHSLTLHPVTKGCVVEQDLV